jgi:hypothetical protein
MSPFLQNLLAILLVALAATYTLFQATKSLRGKASKLGSCCSKGCSSLEKSPTESAQPKTQFLPADMLKRRS